MAKAINIHGTAIAIGTRGLLFVGPSGAGKSSLALNCLESARRDGQFAALIADDQVFLNNANGQVVATRPPSTAGLIEIRHSGIATIDSIEAAIIHLVILVVDRQNAERLPPDDEAYDLPIGLSLPLLRISHDTPSPLTAIIGLRPDLIL